MKVNNKVPFVLLIVAILVKFAWFYNMTSVTNNYLVVVLITSIFYGGVILLLAKKPWMSITFAVVLTIIFECEVVYFRYFNKLLSFYNITQARFVNSVSNVMFSLIRVGDVILLLDLICLVIILYSNKDLLKMNHRFRAITLTFVMILVACLTLASFGSDFGISVMNQEFFIYHTIDGLQVYQTEVIEQTPEIVEEPEQRESVKDEAETPEVTANYADIFKGKNVIMIQVESLQDMMLFSEYEGQSITPFMNSLVEKDSFYFSSYYQQLGKGNTSDAEFSSHNSLYPSMEGISYLRYKDYAFKGLPVLLQERGYETMVFHGNEASFWGRDEAYPNQGFDQFYSEEKLEIDEVIGMGLSDQSLFAQGAEILSQVTEPFYGFFITLTNHNPYILPEKDITITLSETDKKSLLGRYIESVKYTDDAIKTFFESLEAKGLLENTVVIIYGDHHGITCMDKSYQKSVSDFLGVEYDLDEMMNVPLIIHAAGSGVSGQFDFTSDQQDLLPTLVNLLGIEDELNMMGQDLLNTEDYFALFQTYMVEGSFIEGDVIFEMSRDGIFEHSRAWNRITKEAVDIASCRAGYERALYELEYSRFLLENNKVIIENSQ